MSLKPPQFTSESEEADWWYQHRALVEAEFLLAGALGQLHRRTSTGETPREPAWDVPQDELDEAKTLLRESGLLD